MWKKSSMVLILFCLACGKAPEPTRLNCSGTSGKVQLAYSVLKQESGAVQTSCSIYDGKTRLATNNAFEPDSKAEKESCFVAGIDGTSTQSFLFANKQAVFYGLGSSDFSNGQVISLACR